MVAIESNVRREPKASIVGIIDTLLGVLSDSTTCGDRETLIQPGEWVDVRCTLPSDHDGNHYDSRSNLEWGNEPLQDYGDRPSYFG
jgi:hypothetical protein